MVQYKSKVHEIKGRNSGLCKVRWLFQIPVLHFYTSTVTARERKCGILGQVRSDFSGYFG